MAALDLSFPHTTHCMPNGNVIISTLGDNKGNAKGQFLLMDAQTWKIKGTWAKQDTPFGYDFWYQPKFNVLVSTEWGAPNKIKPQLNVDDIAKGFYGKELNVFDYTTGQLLDQIQLEPGPGCMPLEIRFLHDPNKAHAFIGTAIGSTVYHLHRLETGKWTADKVVEIPAKKVTGWALPDMPAVITDILVSLDDKYLYISCWIHGDLRQYDITDPFHPKLVGQVFIGGSICSDGAVKVTSDPELKSQPEPVYYGKERIDGGPQMLQLSLDGKRLYMTTSLYSHWDQQFYPDIKKNGAKMVKINVDTENGGLTLDRDFFVDFGKEPYGPVLAHEMRYPGGDCTSDIWMPLGHETENGQCCKSKV